MQSGASLRWNSRQLIKKNLTHRQGSEPTLRSFHSIYTEYGKTIRRQNIPTRGAHTQWSFRQRCRTLLVSLGARCEVDSDHFSHELIERRRWLPAEIPLDFPGVSDHVR